jgi:hypothetical protein
MEAPTHAVLGKGGGAFSSRHPPCSAKLGPIAGFHMLIEQPCRATCKRQEEPRAQAEGTYKNAVEDKAGHVVGMYKLWLKVRTRAAHAESHPGDAGVTRVLLYTNCSPAPVPNSQMGGGGRQAWASGTGTQPQGRV